MEATKVRWETTRGAYSTFIDTNKQYGNSIVLQNTTSGAIWHGLLECWVKSFIICTRVLRLYQAASYTAKAFRELATAQRIELHSRALVSHNSIGVQEHFHGPLHPIFLKIKQNLPSLHPEVCIRYAFKALNDTAGPNGLVPSSLVFGRLTSHPLLQPSLPTQAEITAVMQLARS